MISGATCHYVLSLPINPPLRYLKVFKLKFFKDRFDEVILIIIDEISMMVKKMLHQIEKRGIMGYDIGNPQEHPGCIHKLS